MEGCQKCVDVIDKKGVVLDVNSGRITVFKDPPECRTDQASVFMGGVDTGKINHLSGAEYDFTESDTPAHGKAIKADTGKKVIDLLLEINDYGDLKKVQQYDTIPEYFDNELLLRRLEELEAEPVNNISSCDSSCRGACTGFCAGTCTTECAGCTGSCDRMCNTSCSEACAGCGGTCASSCGGGCSSGCGEGCQGGCGDGCSGSCGNACTGCTGNCYGCQGCGGCGGVGCMGYCTDNCATCTSCTGSCSTNCGSSCSSSCGTCADS